MVQNSQDKHSLRLQAIKIRQQLSSLRRQEAAAFVCKKTLQLAENHHKIMSFASFGDEIDTTLLNESLARMRKLVLPKVGDNQTLVTFHVEHQKTQLVLSTWGVLEPHPDLCQKVPIDEISLVLVPGLAFDENCHRLGYGKGIFDRFLASLPKNVFRIGVGFKEQKLSSLLPYADHDIALDDLLLG